MSQLRWLDKSGSQTAYGPFSKDIWDPNRAIFMGNMGSRTTVTEEAILVDDDTTLGNAMKRNGLDNVPILTKI
jgi:hypothetical protein